MENITRISDLPENITLQIPNSYGGATNQMQQGLPQGLPSQGLQQGMQQGLSQGLQPHGLPTALQPINTQPGGFEQNTPTNYIPINIHPNPYGISPQNPIMAPQTGVPMQQQGVPLQQMQQQRQMQQLSEQQQMELQHMVHHRLPSRDIPIDATGYLNDEQIQANYIPKVKLTKDYIKDYEDITDKKIREHEEKKYRENRIDSLLSEFQVPIFIMILFFLFQLPIINTMIFKKFSFLSIYNLDGNFNFYGLLLKSILFGGLYYSIHKTVSFIVEF